MTVPRRIVVAVADPDLATLCLAVLEAAGHETTRVPPGERLADRVAAANPAAIVLDAGGGASAGDVPDATVEPDAAGPDAGRLDPDGDGWRVLRELRAHDSLAHVPVLALSPDGSPGQQRRAMAVGADELVVVPFSPLVLTFALADALASAADARRRQTVLDLPELLGEAGLDAG